MGRFLTRISSFLLKEIFEVMRQPMLLLTLVLGPFLILLFFGIGFRNEPRALRTLFVVEDENSTMAQKLDEYASTLGPQLIYVDRTDNLNEAKERLRRGEVDLVTILPDNAYRTILNNRQAVFQLLHNEIDPFQSDYVNVFGRVYVNEVNRRVLRFVTAEGQLDLTQVQEKLDEARSSASALGELLQRCAEAIAETGRDEQCDSEAAVKYLQELDRDIDELNLAVEDDLLLSQALEQEVGTSLDTEDQNEDSPTIERIIDQKDLLEEQAETVDEYLKQVQTLTRLEADLGVIEERLKEFLNINPSILVTPFRSEVNSVATVQFNVNDFYAPAVIVLLLQHLILTFAALSMVRERQLGSIELFHVAPISPFEILVGKYASYMLFGSVLAAILFALIVFGMGVPMLGSWLVIALVTAAVLFSSLGVGFVISLVSKSDTQAVQYAMIVLLTSVFFSGFLLGLNTLWEPVRVISWSIPATYGILLLRDIMLRGASLDLLVFIPLAGIGLALFWLAWLLLDLSMEEI